MHQYTEKLIADFQRHENPDAAAETKQYMQGQFDYLGVNATLRKEISKSYLNRQGLPGLKEVPEIIRDIWDQPYRELYYFGIDLARKFAKKCPESWIDLCEDMITHKSWWDTVDLIASNLVGPYFKSYPEKRDVYVDKWLRSKNIWLQRTTLLFQLKYGKTTDTKVLEKAISYCKDSDEFFLRKAIGWALRQYGKFDPEYVRGFVKRNKDLSNLSKKEALKLIK